MLIRGREIKFLRTVQAACDIADLCPNGELQNIGKLFEGTTKHRIQNMAYFIQFMNVGYEDAKSFDEPDYTANPLSVKEIMCLEEDAFNELFVEATEAFRKDVQTVEVEPDKKKEEEEKTETLD